MIVCHRKPPKEPPPPNPTFLPIFLFSLFTLHHRVTSDLTQETQALQTFITTLPHDPRYSWNPSEFICDWRGVTCDPTNSSVIDLRLPAARLAGKIPANTIGTLAQLRVLSLRSNSLTGVLPSDFSNLVSLQTVYLQNNFFSGEIPFSGDNFKNLTNLLLQNNQFSGQLPSLHVDSLVDFNVSSNKLNGSIPTSFSKFPLSVFSGNINLCGNPLPPCNNTSPSPSPAPSPPPSPAPARKKSKKLSTGAIVGIAVGSALILALLLPILLLCLRKKTTQQSNQPPKPMSQAAAGGSTTDGNSNGNGNSSSKNLFLRLRKKTTQQSNQPPKPPSHAAAGGSATGNGTGNSSSKDELTGGKTGGERSKLVFFEGGAYMFNLEDLLRASAEVLGKGSVGTSYKAVLEVGTTVVVKRLKEVGVTQKDFESQMEVLGKMKNENVVPLRAYYYSKDEKLVVLDYMPAASLSDLLHGNRGSVRTPLDWEHRKGIALSAARGVAYLHVAGRVVHGNIKSSNILLRQDTNKVALVSDYGLNTLFVGLSFQNNWLNGYRAPEVVEARRATFKADVYGFGVLLLELLTGKAPNQGSLGEEGIDLPQWVYSVVKEEWTAEVFDVELLRYQNVEEEMVQLLQIAVTCVSIVPDQRPAMQEVVRMMEDILTLESG